MLTLLKLLEGPGSLRLFMVIGAIGLLLYRWAPGRWLRNMVAAGLVVLVGSYVVLALPPTATTLLNALPAPPPHTATEDLADVRTLYIFDGDNRDGRAHAAVSVAAHAPLDEAWLLGQEYMIEELVLAGFPPRLLRYDATATNTQAQVEQVKAFSATRPGRAAIVASRLSLPRIRMFVEAAGFDPLLIAAPLDREPATHGLWQAVPTLGSLAASRDAIYEISALKYYRKRRAP